MLYFWKRKVEARGKHSDFVQIWIVQKPKNVSFLDYDQKLDVSSRRLITSFLVANQITTRERKVSSHTYAYKLKS